MIKYIFLSGIHGSGKSTLATKLKNELNIQSVSVSDLIMRSGKNLDPNTKRTESISQNQELWKNELNKMDIGNSILLLDGHFCLFDINKQITPLPFSTFEGTYMTKIIFIKNSPEIIRKRLLNRDNVNYSIELLEKLQDCEWLQANKYSTENNIKLFIYDECQPFSELLNFITD